MLSFGATKNGAFAAEAIIDFRPGGSRGLLYRRMRSGQLLSKLRLVSAQLLAYLENDLWLALAEPANRAAAKLAAALEASPQATLLHPVQANEIFVRLEDELVRRLRAAGFDLRPRHSLAGSAFRLVTSHDTTELEICRFVDTVSAARGSLQSIPSG